MVMLTMATRRFMMTVHNRYDNDDDDDDDDDKKEEAKEEAKDEDADNVDIDDDAYDFKKNITTLPGRCSMMIEKK